MQVSNMPESIYPWRRDNHEFNVHGIRIQEQSPDRSPPNPRKEVGNYYHNILKTGILLRDFQDSL